MQVREWMLHVATLIVLVVGAVLVIYELRQTKAVAQAQLAADMYSFMSNQQIALLGENPLSALAKECKGEKLNEEEALVLRPLFDPVQHPPHGGGLVDAEAREVDTADVASILKSVEAAAPNDRLHAEVHKPSRMEQAGPVIRTAQFRGERPDSDRAVLFGFGIEGRIDG